MGKSHSIANYIQDTEYLLAKYKAVQEAFPDATCSSYGDFCAKSANTKYTQFEFLRNYGGLFVTPYCEVMLEHGSKEELIKVHTSPRASRLVYLQRWKQPQIIKFSRLSVNLKNNHFKEDMMNACRAEIMKFIAENPKYKLDDKHLEPRLKKLLMFT